MILSKIKDRKNAKDNGNYELADKIRDELNNEGIDIKDIKLLSTAPRIGSDMISFNKNKIPEKINDVQNCNMYMDDMYDFLSLFSDCTENFINAVSIPYLYTTKAKPINA